RWHNGAVNNAVEHVFDGPGKFAYVICTHHPAAAFQGMERAAEFGQGIRILKVLCPEWEVFADGLSNLAGFFNKDVDDFIVEIIVIISNIFSSRGVADGFLGDWFRFRFRSAF